MVATLLLVILAATFLQKVSAGGAGQPEVVVDARTVSIPRITGAEIGCPNTFVEISTMQWRAVQRSPQDDTVLRLVGASIIGRGKTSSPEDRTCDARVDIKAFCINADPVRCQSGHQLNFETVPNCPHYFMGYSGDVMAEFGDCPTNPYWFDLVFWGDNQGSASLALWWGAVPDADEGQFVTYHIFIYIENGADTVSRTFEGPIRLDDGMEPNDVSADAFPLAPSTQTYPNLLVVHEEDWYRQSTTGSSSMIVTIRFEQDWGDLDLCVYANSGSLIACSQSSTPGTGTESESVNTVTSGGGAPWRIRVYGNPTAVINVYDMTVVLSGGGGGGGGGCKCFMLSTSSNVTRISSTKLQFDVGLGMNDSSSLSATYVSYRVNGGTIATQPMQLTSGTSSFGYWRATVTVSTNLGDTVSYWFRGHGVNETAIYHGPRSTTVQGGGLGSSLGWQPGGLQISSAPDAGRLL